MTSNHELVGRALGLLHQGLYPFVEREMRSVHNQRVGENQYELSVPQKDFLEFVNDEKSDLTLIPGIGKKSTMRIAENRPYTSLEDMQNKLGSKAPLKKWLKGYQQNDKLK
jgi:radical SAM superfamily enzyme with C-terminal helix-hairpin-helix motif